ncbi:MAG: leucine-rich repeat domain-containing protein [Bacteroidales bacterium]|nr:leucine-rich repeat domain-containing protein [Bacteroidales bacterium]
MSTQTTKPIATYVDVPYVERQVNQRLSEVMANNAIDPPESGEWTAQAQAIEDTLAGLKADYAETVAAKDAEIAELEDDYAEARAEVNRLTPYYDTMAAMKQLYNAFYSAPSTLTEVTLYGPNATSLQYAFKYSYVKKINGYYGGSSMAYAFHYSYATSLDFTEFLAPNLTSLNYTFYYSRAVSINLGGLDTSKVTNFGYLFYYCSSLKYVYGTLSVESLSSTSTTYWNNYAMYYVTALRRLHLKGIGTKSELTSFRAVASNWGYEDGTEADEGNLQSLVDSLVNGTYDRASAGRSTCTLTLHTNCAARLTSEQKAAITAKGYTISTVSTTY